jgi:cell shape-determining protein MreC
MRLSNILNIVKTIFICVIFSVGTMYFFKDVLETVVEPLESIISKIKDMTVNPLNALQQSEKDQFLNILQNETNKNQFCYKKVKKEPLETQVLEKTITKIGALLALGFGEAGTQIIAQNLSNSSKEIIFSLKITIFFF